MSSSARPVLQVLRQLVANRVAATGFESVLKQIRVVDGEEGRCVCELVVSPELSNPRGSLHGGVAATLVDIVSTWAVMTTGEKKPGVSVDLSISFLKAAPTGEPILIDARTLRVGKTLAFLTVDILKKDCGTLLAQGKHTMFMRV
ncbi:acyl-coenzyme A thioesterase 13-like [Haliotis asinina]|uniref:acyl-coenzyme A thioesterase 13-like n=1 Tax=Haliotis asinina TaxID=109174 RepID=UPI003532447B